jgi:DNA-binding XRE family transcriptional regulator
MIKSRTNRGDLTMKWSDMKRDINSISEKEKIYLELLVDIVTVRIDKNVTQRELAERSGLKQSAIARIESPTNHAASLRTVIKYLDSLGMKLKVVSKGED